MQRFIHSGARNRTGATLNTVLEKIVDGITKRQCTPNKGDRVNTLYGFFPLSPTWLF